MRRSFFWLVLMAHLGVQAQTLQLQTVDKLPVQEAHIAIAFNKKVAHLITDSRGMAQLESIQDKSLLSITHVQFRDTSFHYNNLATTDTLLITLQYQVVELPEFGMATVEVGDDKVNKKIHGCYYGDQADTIVLAFRISRSKPFKAKNISLYFDANDTAWHTVKTVVSEELLRKDQLMKLNVDQERIMGLTGVSWVSFPIDAAAQDYSSSCFIYLVMIPQHRSNNPSTWCARGNLFGRIYYSKRGEQKLARARGITIAHRVEIIEE